MRRRTNQILKICSGLQDGGGALCLFQAKILNLMLSPVTWHGRLALDDVCQGYSGLDVVWIQQLIHHLVLHPTYIQSSHRCALITECVNDYATKKTIWWSWWSWIQHCYCHSSWHEDFSVYNLGVHQYANISRFHHHEQCIGALFLCVYICIRTDIACCK